VVTLLFASPEGTLGAVVSAAADVVALTAPDCAEVLPVGS
jgi:hypothetical protein